jgi:hypothetical protein
MTAGGIGDCRSSRPSPGTVTIGGPGRTSEPMHPALLSRRDGWGGIAASRRRRDRIICEVDGGRNRKDIT